MESIDSDACFKAFNVLCEELNTSELVVTQELQYWVFECGYKVALATLANMQKVDSKFLEAVWSNQPSLEQDLALY